MDENYDNILLLTSKILGNESIWKINLNSIPDLTRDVSSNLENIMANGIRNSLIGTVNQ